VQEKKENKNAKKEKTISQQNVHHQPEINKKSRMDLEKCVKEKDRIIEKKEVLVGKYMPSFNPVLNDKKVANKRYSSVDDVYTEEKFSLKDSASSRLSTSLTKMNISPKKTRNTSSPRTKRSHVNHSFMCKSVDFYEKDLQISLEMTMRKKDSSSSSIKTSRMASHRPNATRSHINNANLEFAVLNMSKAREKYNRLNKKC